MGHDASVTASTATGTAAPAAVAGEAVTAVPAAAARARQGGRVALAQALQASRADTLATWAAYEQALPGLQVPQRPDLNPPLWELGHIGWFQAFWLQRFAGRHQGAAADPDTARGPAVPAEADALYHSSHVAHARRWQLPLPTADGTRAHLADQLASTLALLADSPETDDALYFFRLALLHEDMHHEAALYMAQALGVPVADTRWQPPVLPAPPAALRFDASRWQLGSPADAGFAFDNEWQAHDQAVPACRIDAQAVRWAEYLPFVDAGGYQQPQWWCDAGWAWLQGPVAGPTSAQVPRQAPRYLRRHPDDPRQWQQQRHGRWRPLVPEHAACHLTAYEAAAWCRWAGRRLPTEAEWERAACSAPGAFAWGAVWEWTASPFTPYPGFTAHPYRDYSAPWFDGRPVLRGASFMTQPRMRHPRYRNYFQAWRHDVPAGFRSCAV